MNAVVNKTEQIIPGFDGDTLVQTQLGYCDIEHIEIGDLVLSRCEKTGQQGYRRVIRKFEHECAESYVVYFEHKNSIGDAVFEDHSAVYTTAEHPFWVNGIGWVPASELQPGYELEIVDPISVGDEYRKEGQRKTQLALSGGRWQAKVTKVEKRNNVRQYAGETYLQTVFNIEVEEFHTYFVDWSGIWVHDKNLIEATKPLGRTTLSNPLKGLIENPENYSRGKTVETRVRQTDLEAACFDGETKVIVENGELEDIQYIDVGRLVLSRCEKTGETAYRKVLKRFHRHRVPTYLLFCMTVGGWNEQPIETTAEHPFWVKGKGWTPVIELLPGDVFENKDGTQTTVWKCRETGRTNDVYNLEIEEFNTYFVGEYGYWVHDCNAPELKGRKTVSMS